MCLLVYCYSPGILLVLGTDGAWQGLWLYEPMLWQHVNSNDNCVCEAQYRWGVKGITLVWYCNIRLMFSLSQISSLPNHTTNHASHIETTLHCSVDSQTFWQTPVFHWPGVKRGRERVWAKEREHWGLHMSGSWKKKRVPRRQRMERQINISLILQHRAISV